jgi:single-stranded-DNA-specific exonuclease
MEKRWKISQPAEPMVIALQSALHVNKSICGILVQRGIKNYDEAKKFFRPSMDDLHDPWLMKDMEKAVSRILTAIDQKEKILVFGDYDVDGTTSVACMYDFLQGICTHHLLDFYIPHRYKEGYGVSRIGIDFAKQHGFSLIICLDCGIKSVDLVAYAKELGIEFIICDHHLPEPELPQAYAILNPKQNDCRYPYKELCACGVGFKLITALARRLAIPDSKILSYLDLVATAIAADIVPITGENRTLAYYGLKKVNETPNSGIKALMTLNNWKKELRISNLVYIIAPRVNAAGRMDDARKAVLMFVAGSEEEALYFARMLHMDNANRKETDIIITEEALSIIEADESLKRRNTTVVFQPHWHKGVVGIVASRLIEKYYRPTVVLTKSGEFAAGSARSVNGFNLYEAVHGCKEYLVGYGGHYAAAGLTLQLDQIKAFSEKFEQVVTSSIDPSLLIPQILVDGEIDFKEISRPLFNILEQMEPFGPDNLQPVFIAKKAEDTGYSRIVKGNHIRFSLRQGNTIISGIGFNMAEKFNLLQSKGPVDILFSIDENEWNDQKLLQIKVVDLRASGIEDAIHI